MLKRMSAFLIDYYIILFCTSVFLLLSILSKNVFSSSVYSGLFCFTTLLLVFMKDLFYKNSSIGKKTMGLEIKGYDGEAIPKTYLIIRNLTTILWPIEFLVLLVTRSRISDKFLNLEVVEIAQPNIVGKIILCFVKIYFYLTIFMLSIAILVLLFI